MKKVTQQEIEDIEVAFQQSEDYDEYIQSLKDEHDQEIDGYIKNRQNKEVLSVVKNINKIQSKKYLTSKELAEVYSISESSQKNYRGRLNDPLPFHQKVARGKILYVVDKVEKWLQNQHL